MKKKSLELSVHHVFLCITQYWRGWETLTYGRCGPGQKNTRVYFSDKRKCKHMYVFI